MTNAEYYKDKIQAIGWANVALVDGKITDQCGIVCAECDWNKNKGSNGGNVFDCNNALFSWLVSEYEGE